MTYPRRPTLLFACLALTITLQRCDSNHSSSPTAPSAFGQLRFVDSGCACVKPPYPNLSVFVDGQKAGELPVFGELNVAVPAGNHVWAIDSSGPTTSIQVVSGTTMTVHVFTNLGCVDGCTD